MNWKPIETAPTTGVVVILWARPHSDSTAPFAACLGRYDSGGYTEGWETPNGNWLVATRWMPLPEPPK